MQTMFINEFCRIVKKGLSKELNLVHMGRKPWNM